MTGKYWLDLSPSLLVAVGVVAATFLAARAVEAGWWVVAGPLLLAAWVTILLRSEDGRRACRANAGR